MCPFDSQTRKGGAQVEEILQGEIVGLGLQKPKLARLREPCLYFVGIVAHSHIVYNASAKGRQTFAL